MARQRIESGAWTTIGAITKDTAYVIEGGTARLQTGAAAPTDVLDGIPFGPGEKVVIAGGKTVYAIAASTACYITSMEIGV